MKTLLAAALSAAFLVHAGQAEGQADEHAAGPHGAHEAEEQDEARHAGHEPEQPAPSRRNAPPAAAYSGPRHAADALFGPEEMDRARHGLRHEHGAIRTGGVRVDRLEIPFESGRDGYAWDAHAWYGGDIDKLWIRTEGEGRFGGRTEGAELQALFSRAVTPWFDVQAGVRYDFRPDPSRAHLVLGLQGLVPFLFKVNAAGFVSEEGDVSARVEAEYDLLITQRVVLQPRAEVELAAEDVPELGIGSGVSDVELGLRLRYEISRDLAPHVGLRWKKALGETADFARGEGEETSDLSLLVGVSFGF